MILNPKLNLDWINVWLQRAWATESMVPEFKIWLRTACTSCCRKHCSWAIVFLVWVTFFIALFVFASSLIKTPWNWLKEKHVYLTLASLTIVLSGVCFTAYVSLKLYSTTYMYCLLTSKKKYNIQFKPSSCLLGLKNVGWTLL